MKRHSGFTLIELSIALVIIGLIVGGVLMGKDLIKAAELRKASAEFAKTISAVNTFKGKYNGLPGDMANATQFWGTASDCSDAASASVNTQATCNGNGDGAIGGGTWGASCTALQYTNATMGFNYLCTRRENFTFWQQLGYAGLINKTYSGAAAAVPNYGGGGGFWPDVNVPKANIACKSFYGCLYPDLMWFVWSQEAVTGSYIGRYWSGMMPFRNAISLVAVSTTNFVWTGMNASDAFAIDSKIDDGKGNTGAIEADNFIWSIMACFDPANGSYYVSTAPYATSGGCGLHFNNAF